MRIWNREMAIAECGARMNIHLKNRLIIGYIGYRGRKKQGFQNVLVCLVPITKFCRQGGA